ncbi:hypothetical protein MRX96_000604 [Rhipicephalus microplus]
MGSELWLSLLPPGWHAGWAALHGGVRSKVVEEPQDAGRGGTVLGLLQPVAHSENVDSKLRNKSRGERENRNERAKSRKSSRAKRTKACREAGTSGVLTGDTRLQIMGPRKG